MDAFAIALNEVLVDTYHNILRVEEKALKKSGRIHLSIKEMHLIEAVGKGEDCLLYTSIWGAVGSSC